MAVASGLGFAGLLRRLEPRSPWLPWVPRAVAALFVIGVAAHAGRANGRNNTVLRDFVTTLFASLPPGAIVMTTMGDDVNGAVAYFHAVEKLRPDVVHLDCYRLSTPWGVARQRRLHPEVVLPEGEYRKRGWHIKQLLEANPTRPLVVIGHLDDWD